MQPIRTIWTILVEDHPGTIPVEFGQIPMKAGGTGITNSSMWPSSMTLKQGQMSEREQKNVVHNVHITTYSPSKFLYLA